ncbi:hypothetical protein CDAR_602641 [Caerostris darwini]|uniref:Uncharacterized protein n=1 Tax=Caerostris darwini TaxID=1538125 RepID=A0AAV4QKU9_9ARAC|nr:hypothetical protein CDAR_602641 [Caerostris darwini]
MVSFQLQGKFNKQTQVRHNFQAKRSVFKTFTGAIYLSSDLENGSCWPINFYIKSKPIAHRSADSDVINQSLFPFAMCVFQMFQKKKKKCDAGGKRGCDCLIGKTDESSGSQPVTVPHVSFFHFTTSSFLQEKGFLTFAHKTEEDSVCTLSTNGGKYSAENAFLVNTERFNWQSVEMLRIFHKVVK